MWCFRIKEMRVPGIARALSLCVCVHHCYVCLWRLCLSNTGIVCVSKRRNVGSHKQRYAIAQGVRTNRFWLIPMCSPPTSAPNAIAGGGAPRWAGSRRNIHPLTSILNIRIFYQLPLTTTIHSILLQVRSHFHATYCFAHSCCTTFLL